jgi:hypothetical protein
MILSSSGPMATKKLMDFLNHLNGLHNKIQFTMEKEEEGHLPFLDIDLYRKTDGSLGHRVYRKPTHTNLYTRIRITILLTKNQCLLP